MHVYSRLVFGINFINFRTSSTDQYALSFVIPINWLDSRIKLWKVFHLNCSCWSHRHRHETDWTIISSTNEVFSIKNDCLNIDLSVHYFLSFCRISSIPFNDESILWSRVEFTPSFSHPKAGNNTDFSIKSLSTVQLCSLHVPKFNMFKSKSYKINIILPNSSKHLALIYLGVHLCSLFPIINSYRMIIIIPNTQKLISFRIKLHNWNCSSVESLQVFQTFERLQAPNIHINKLGLICMSHLPCCYNLPIRMDV